MGSYLDYACGFCGFEVSIGGPEEFYLAGAERRTYGHPDPVSAEAQARGVDGFWMTLWCPGCQAAKRLVTAEFEEPAEPLEAWTGRARMKPGYPASAERCPECAELLDDQIPGPEAACPTCKRAPLGVRRAAT